MNFLKFFLPIVFVVANTSYMKAASGWDQLDSILSQINEPVFKKVDYNIIDYGAANNGITLSTSAIQNAIDSCSANGGGRVIVPAGNFLTGGLKLKDSVNLYISSGATLKFSTNPDHYLPVVYTRFEGVECYNYSPLIYSYEAKNIAITGPGTLDGQASTDNWWDWKSSGKTDVTLLNSMGEDGTPVDQRVFGSGHKIRVSFIQFYKSSDILIDSINIIYSPMWEIHPVLSQNITVRNVNVNSHGPNNDGCNPECSKNVLIYNCTFDTGDDCIAIKSGRNNDGRRVNTPSENIIVQKCTMKDGHGGVVMGSECSGSIRNVFVEDCNMSSPNLDRALRIKTNSIRGGVIENVFMRNCTIGQVGGEVIRVNMYYQEGDVGDFTPAVRNIEVENITSSKSPNVFYLNCYSRSPVTNIKINNCNFNNASETGTLENVSKLQINNSFINGTIPLIPSVTSGYTEAGAYDSKTEWGWSNVLSGFKGNGYMESADKNNLIEWNVLKTKNEMDSLVIRYANITSSNKPCSVYVNNIFNGILAFTPTNSNWINTGIPVTMSNGNNTIRLVSGYYDTSTYIDRVSLKYISDISGIKEKEEAYVSLNCYPDIIKENSIIEFFMPNAGEVKILLYDINGRPAKILMNGAASQGKTSIAFDKADLKQGMYILSLHTNGIKKTSKVIIE